QRAEILVVELGYLAVLGLQPGLELFECFGRFERFCRSRAALQAGISGSARICGRRSFARLAVRGAALLFVVERFAHVAKRAGLVLPEVKHDQAVCQCRKGTEMAAG